MQYAWNYGLFLIVYGYYWEAHEVLEPVWMTAPPNSRERALLQGLIQLANAFLKADMGNDRAARRIAGLASQCFVEAHARKGDLVMNLDAARLANEVEPLCEAVTATREMALKELLLVDI